MQWRDLVLLVEGIMEKPIGFQSYNQVTKTSTIAELTEYHCK